MMGIEAGVVFAFFSLISWGFGDFLIQRSVRRFGDWEALFIITFFGFLITTPFALGSLPALFSLQDGSLLVLLALSVVIFIAAMLDFEALRKGKIAVIEPTHALEVPVAGLLAFMVVSEGLEITEIALVSVILAGIVLVSLRSHHMTRRHWAEKGVVLGILGALFMGASNFLVGLGSRMTDPMTANWFLNVFIATACLAYIVANGRLGKLRRDFTENRKLVLIVCTTDNLAWITFAFAATMIPIAIATAISESYIALAALLGLIVNRELLRTHQKAGLLLTLAGALALAMVVAA